MAKITKKPPAGAGPVTTAGLAPNRLGSQSKSAPRGGKCFLARKRRGKAAVPEVERPECRRDAIGS